MSTRISILLGVLCLVVLPTTGETLYAQANVSSSADAESVQSGREALGNSNYPWYDKEADEFKRISVAPKKTSGPKKDKWEADIKAPNWSFSNIFGAGFWGFLKVIGWLFLGAILALLIYLLVKAFLSKEDFGRIDSAAQTEEQERRGEIDRIENLPFQVRRPRSNLLDEARRQYDAGNFSEAIIYLYSYQLVQLDKHQHIHLTKGKTNRQYLREIRPLPNLAKILLATMVAFEDVFFGDHNLDRRSFESCWSQLDSFHHLVGEAMS